MFRDHRNIRISDYMSTCRLELYLIRIVLLHTVVDITKPSSGQHI